MKRVLRGSGVVVSGIVGLVLSLAVLHPDICGSLRAAEPVQEMSERTGTPADTRANRLRNPFSPPVSSTRRAGAAEKELFFDGSNASIARLPGIKVTGLLAYGGKIKISAFVEGLGPVVLQENDQVVLHGARGSNTTAYFVIKKLRRDSMTIILDDGSTITGKYY